MEQTIEKAEATDEEGGIDLDKKWECGWKMSPNGTA